MAQLCLLSSQQPCELGKADGWWLSQSQPASFMAGQEFEPRFP